MEPFKIIYFKISLSALIVNHVPSSLLSIESICPFPSTCPLTICPPNLSLTFKALSKLTLLPSFNLPRFVLSKVSPIISATKELLFILFTVRHTPLTAILSPILVSSKTLLHSISIFPKPLPIDSSLRLPISSTIPVNIKVPPF